MLRRRPYIFILERVTIMTDEEQVYYSENNKCCGTCQWHCLNPNNASKIGKPWLCGNEECSSFKRAKPNGNGTRCKSWEARNPYEWIYSCYYLVKCTSKPEAVWQVNGGHQGLHHLYFIAPAVRKYYDEELNHEMFFNDFVRKDDKKTAKEVAESIRRMCARAFHMTTKDVDICLKHCKEVEV